MLERAKELDRDRKLVSRAPARLRGGHRREYDPRKDDERLSFRQRSERDLADVGIYRSVSFRDLAEVHFGGHPYTTRRAAGGQGLDPQQRTWSGLVKPSELAHDTEVYRACGFQFRWLASQGASIRRIRIDSELKSAVARRSEKARVRHGKRAADSTRGRVAQEIGLPVDEQGRILYPDAQLEYTDADGRTGRVNIEVASSHYRGPSIRAKSNAGFTLHATGTAKARVLKAFGNNRGVGNDGTKGPGCLRAVRGDATLESQRRLDHFLDRVGGSASRLSPQVSGAFLEGDPGRPWREHCSTPGAGSSDRCGHPLWSGAGRRSCRSRPEGGSCRALDSAWGGRPGTCPSAAAGCRGRVGITTMTTGSERGAHLLGFRKRRLYREEVLLS